MPTKHCFINMTKLVANSSLPTSLHFPKNLIIPAKSFTNPNMIWIPKIVSDHANILSAKTIVSTTASLAASAMVIRSITRFLIPYQLQNYIQTLIQDLFTQYFSSETTVIIEQSNGLSTNQIYKAAKLYLGTKISPTTNMFTVTMPRMESNISTSMAKNQQLIDTFNGASLKWKHIARVVDPARPTPPGTSFLELRFHKKHKQMVMNEYFAYILDESRAIREERKALKIHTLKVDRRSPGELSWSSIKLDHPATFETVAMDAEMKREIVEDLEMFVRRREFYRKVGKAWKRGYLLYGPPGTGKSSLIAAMANYLNFDVYDLELASIGSNADLRRLLINTAGRSILVVEDIDCSLEVEDRKDEEKALSMLKSSKTQIETLNIVRKDKPNQVTLSGLLNFIDGLWSSCGDERIIVFTTNHKDRLDPALLRPGRMDMHIHMSYCTPQAFRALAANYHGIEHHAIFDQIDELLEAAMVTPAEVGEQLLRSESAEVAMAGLVEILEQKIRKINEQKEKELELVEDEHEK